MAYDPFTAAEPLFLQ